MKIYSLRLTHILLIALAAIVVITATINSTILSKPAIMQIIDYTLQIVNTPISPVDSLMIARVIRQQIWQVHFYTGTALFVVASITFFIYSKTAGFNMNRNTTNIIKVMAASIGFMAVVGAVMYYRVQLGLSTEVFETLKAVHWYSMWVILLIVMMHLASLFKRVEN